MREHKTAAVVSRHGMHGFGLLLPIPHVTLGHPSLNRDYWAARINTVETGKPFRQQLFEVSWEKLSNVEEKNSPSDLVLTIKPCKAMIITLG